MNIIEKINFLLLEKGLTKKEFSDSLRKLEPKLFATGEIPYIAEVLGVTEQDLFTFELEYAQNHNYKQTKEVREIIELLPYAPASVARHIKEQLQKYKKLHNETIKNF